VSAALISQPENNFFCVATVETIVYAVTVLLGLGLYTYSPDACSANFMMDPSRRCTRRAASKAVDMKGGFLVEPDFSYFFAF